MKYKGYEIKRVDDRNRGWGIFLQGTNKHAWLCGGTLGNIIVNHFPHRTRGDAKQWIDEGFPVVFPLFGKLIFASSREEAEQAMYKKLASWQLTKEQDEVLTRLEEQCRQKDNPVWVGKTKDMQEIGLTRPMLNEFERRGYILAPYMQVGDYWTIKPTRQQGLDNDAFRRKAEEE